MFCGKFTSRLQERATPCSKITHLQPGSFVHQIASAKRLFLHGQTPHFVIHPAVAQLKLPWRYHHLPLSTRREHQKFTNPHKKTLFPHPKVLPLLPHISFALVQNSFFALSVSLFPSQQKSCSLQRWSLVDVSIPGIPVFPDAVPRLSRMAGF